MARYSRDFLVPYLQNICALHLLHNKVRDHCRTLMEKENQIVRGTRVQRPIEPQWRGNGCAGGLIAFGVVCLFGFVMTLDIFQNAGWITVLFLVGGVLFVLCGIVENKSTKKAFELQYHQYKTELNRYERIQEDDKMARATIPLLQKERAQYEAEYRKLEELLEEAYNVNIIPRQYRDIYAAVYLYDWFSTGGSDDMDMALNMYVLEEIKDRLDRIIRNQYEMLMNQQTMIANQYRTLEQQRSYEKMMQQKLDQINANAEEQTRYMRMIECNTSTMAYFSAADYIRSI